MSEDRKPVDWTQPVEVQGMDGWAPAEVLRVLPNGDAVLLVEQWHNWATTRGPLSSDVRNVTEPAPSSKDRKPVDWTQPVEILGLDSWAPAEVLRVLPNGDAVLLTKACNNWATKRGPFSYDVRNAPQPVPVWATPGLKPEVGKSYRTRYGRRDVRNAPQPVPVWATPGLKPEVGKSYRTRDGRRVEVQEYRPTGIHGGLRAYPLICSDGELRTIFGAVWTNKGSDQGDLVAEWQPPQPFEKWINVYEWSYDSRQAANECQCPDRLALIHLVCDGEHLTVEVIE